MRLLAIVVCFAAVFAPTRAGALDQSVTVSRPAGQLAIEVRGNAIVVTDTRADDPGWTVSGVRSVLPGHGLGITSVHVPLTSPTVTITVI